MPDRLLWLDSRAGLAVGVGMLLLSTWLSELYAMPRALVVAIGVVHLLYGTASGILRRQATRRLAWVVALVVANATWALLCLGMMLALRDTASPLGLASRGAEALFVGGLAVVEWLLLAPALGNPSATARAVVEFFGYFTILTNLFVALVATAGVLAGGRATRTGLFQPMVVGAASTAILLVGLAYHLLLQRLWAPEGLALVADALLHYAVPVGALAIWLTYPHRVPLALTAPLRWASYPIAYLSYALIRGELLGRYPYPFINVLDIGYRQILVNSVGLLVVFLVFGYLLLGWARVAARRTALTG
jgi:hypothetical protein